MDARPIALTVNFEELFIETPQEGKIHALWLKTENPKGLVYYLHGNTGSLNRWGYMAEEICGYGYDVFAIDYRGYGKSVGKRSEENLNSDAKFCFDFIAEKYPQGKKIIYGRSLGTGMAIRLATKVEVEKIILETPYNSFYAVARHYVPFLPMRFLLRYEFNSMKWIKEVNCPVCIFHGTKDRIIPYRFAMDLYKHGEESLDIKMVTVVGGKHNNLNAYPIFREKLSEFLE